ncbi:putative phage holin [Mycolicibacterium gilvum]|uniref:putative phage holin n=1 Tax=Mycolicibacterium gilvum TaxID=1804 RepID=UPI0040468265
MATFIADIWAPIDYRVAANVSLIYVAALTTIFVLLYGIRSNWRANQVGRTLFAKSVVLPFVLWQIVLATWWDTDFPYRQQVQFIIYSLGAVAYVTMTVLLWREQQSDRSEKK